MPCQSQNGPNTTTGTTPTTTVKARGTTSNSHQGHGQKRRAGDLFNDVVGVEPTGNREQALLVKKGKPSQPNGQASGHSVPCSAGKGIQGQTKRSTAAEDEAKGQVRDGDNVRSGVAKRRTVASNDVDTDADSNLETPRRPAKKVKTHGIQHTGMFSHNT